MLELERAFKGDHKDVFKKNRATVKRLKYSFDIESFALDESLAVVKEHLEKTNNK